MVSHCRRLKLKLCQTIRFMLIDEVALEVAVCISDISFSLSLHLQLLHSTTETTAKAMREKISSFMAISRSFPFPR